MTDLDAIRCTCAVGTPGAPLCPMHERVLRPLSWETLASMVVDMEAALDAERAEVERSDVARSLLREAVVSTAAMERARIAEVVRGLEDELAMALIPIVAAWDAGETDNVQVARLILRLVAGSIEGAEP